LNKVKEGKLTSDYDYELPHGRIAYYPIEHRDQSRLLIVPRDAPHFQHRHFLNLVDLLDPGDVVVVNESQVIPARLLGTKPTGAPSEILLLRPYIESGQPSLLNAKLNDVKTWEALVRPGGKLKPGRLVNIVPGFDVKIVAGAPGGVRIVKLLVEGSVQEALERHGHIPLPPYIEREDELLDRDRYQTVYARVPGSVAAPTAGLHFTSELLEAINSKGVHRVAVTLDVGVGTFRPIEVYDPEDHEMHAESYFIPEESAMVINAAKKDGKRIWAIGTTVVRALESSTFDGVLVTGNGTTDLFIKPGYSFQMVDCLVTNFHLPKSTLLMLVAAFAGYDRTMDAYKEAIRENYRFYSYGDAMVID
tara:strand:- start:518 stop:1603 length:1086 start_codon:yes stop_codon:yes gene_type:complete